MSHPQLHYADICESIADAIPDLPAIIQGDRTIAWRDFDDRASRLAAAFAAAGLGPDAKVAMFMYSCPEYIETQLAALKCRGVPVNVNYRYLDDELAYLLENADAEIVVFHTSLGERIERVRDRLPKLRMVVEVDDGGPHVSGAEHYDALLTAYEPAPRIERSPDDVYMLYTGGTTGMPKGVMFSIGEFCLQYLTLAPVAFGLESITDPADAAPAAAKLAAEGRLTRTLPACPIMHGTGMWLGVMIPHLMGATVVLLESRHFDAAEAWDTISRHQVNTAVIVGDPFAKPMATALAEGGERDLASLAMLVSSGATLSAEVKEALLEHLPNLIILDVLGSTEGGMAQSAATKDTVGTTSSFAPMPTAKVFDEDDHEVGPGSGVIGRVAVSGLNIPLGYYKDPEKSAATFREIDGVRYSFPGDLAMVEADGAITLLGRGSNVVNSGGEKVYAEEVEEAIKTHPGIDDCLVFGVADERLGQRVVAVAAGGDEVAPDAVIDHVRDRLAHYKAPKELRFVPAVPRAPNGKADYKAARRLFD